MSYLYTLRYPSVFKHGWEVWEHDEVENAGIPNGNENDYRRVSLPSGND